MKIDTPSILGLATGTIATASLAQTASFVTLSQTASFVTLAQSASLLVGSGWTSGGATTITATSANPTKGTTSIDFILYRLVGPKIYEVKMSYYQTAAGSAGNGDYLFTLPAGLQFDTTYQGTNAAVGGFGTMASTIAFIPGSSGIISDTSTVGTLIGYAYDATRFKMVGVSSLGNNAAANGVIKNDYFGLGGSVRAWQMQFTFKAL